MAFDFLVGLGFADRRAGLASNDYLYLGLGLAVIGAFVFIFFTVMAAKAASGSPTC